MLCFNHQFIFVLLFRYDTCSFLLNQKEAITIKRNTKVLTHTLQYLTQIEMSDSPQTYNADPQRAIAANSSYANRSIASSLPIADKPQFSSIGPFGNHYTIDSTAGSIAGTGVGFNDLDNKSVTSKQSKLSKFTYSGMSNIN